MASLLLGPLLRHVGERDATVWVETDSPSEVEVRAGGAHGRERTFTVAGHHYAVIVVTGLEPASSTPYEVRLDGDVAWPLSDSTFPPSRIRTIDPSRPIRLIFGSCREAPSVHPKDPKLDPDVLDAFAKRMATQHHQHWPDLLLLVGDQIYADDTSAAMRDFIRSRRDIRRGSKEQVADFEEYTRLYYESWGDPTIRWLLSTLPSSMVFDDHDVRDDWNTSHAWRLDMQKTDWWEERITGALMSYWIYQHLGNLSPAGLAADELYEIVRDLPDAEAELRAFAQAADREADGAKGAMWSYRRDFGPVRLLVIDSRCGRILADGRRSMISDSEFDWIERQVEDGAFEHLVVATSMPWLLPRALHDIESWNEALCAGSRGRLLARLGERVRRAVDLEHWAAFRKSFDRLAAWFARVGTGEHGGPAPATISVLSGDVHHTYISEADYHGPLESRVYQITCSPIHNTIPLPMRLVFRIGWSKTVEHLVSFLDRWTRVPPLPIAWHHPSGPHFGNTLALLVLDGRSANVVLERAVQGKASANRESRADLEVIEDLSLTEARRVRRASS
jgi:phosphodiesterase/alkaline phosphatase D-like protein